MDKLNLLNYIIEEKLIHYNFCLNNKCLNNCYDKHLHQLSNKFNYTLNYDLNTNILNIPIFNINNIYYIHSDTIFGLFFNNQHFINSKYFIDNILNGDNNILNHNLSFNISNIHYLQHNEILKEIDNGHIIFYYPINKYFKYYCLNKDTNYINTELIKNKYTPELINKQFYIYSQINPIIIKKNLDYNSIIQKIEFEFQNLISENIFLKNKIKDLELNIHYLNLNNINTIKYNYKDIKNKNKQLNNEFKRIYKLINKRDKIN